METRWGHVDNESQIKEIGEVREVKAEEGPNIKETETNMKNPVEKNNHCISESQTRNTSLLFRSVKNKSQILFESF